MLADQSFLLVKGSCLQPHLNLLFIHDCAVIFQVIISKKHHHLRWSWAIKGAQMWCYKKCCLLLTSSRLQGKSLLSSKSLQKSETPDITVSKELCITTFRGQVTVVGSGSQSKNQSFLHMVCRLLCPAGGVLKLSWAAHLRITPSDTQPLALQPTYHPLSHEDNEMPCIVTQALKTCQDMNMNPSFAVCKLDDLDNAVTPLFPL